MAISRLHRLLPMLCMLLLWTMPAGAQPAHEHEHEHSSSEFDLFLSAEAMKSSGNLGAGDDDSWFNADIVFGLTQHQFRVFGEYFITAEEHDLERFQIGYDFAPETTLWIGRFHQPGSAWNTEHHHGRYLQTAITRPSIELWEDEHGAIPQHITGALFESRVPIGGGAIQLATGVGAGPSLSHDGYDPIELLDNNPGHHRISFTGRLAYLPDYVGSSSAGVLFGHHQLALHDPSVIRNLGAERATLGVYGAYVDWNRDPWRAIAAAYYVDLRFAGPIGNESFVAGYAQFERQLPFRLTVFGRTEDSARMRNSHFIAIFDDRDDDLDLAIRRNLLGVRWDYARRQALSIELSRVQALEGHFNEVRAQWSAAVP